MLNESKGNASDFINLLKKRYGDITNDALISVLSPQLIELHTLDKTCIKLDGQKHWRASFTLKITDNNFELMQKGRTGKFVPRSFGEGKNVWKELCKGRITSVDYQQNIAKGEIYVGKTTSKKALQEALNILSEKDYLEIDQYGASAKIVSGLAEYYLSKIAKEAGFLVRRMPEDTAKHLGSYYNYDFEFEKNNITKKIEVKSLWGTNTDFARLIHSTGPDYPTSSCKYETQDIFAVSLFLRTGNIKDFAFARSVSKSLEKPYGLPCATQYPNHVNQNPLCKIGDGSWFTDINEVWNLE